MWQLSVQSFRGYDSVCLCDVAAVKGSGVFVAAALLLSSALYSMRSTMHIDFCALNRYGCLLVALDVSVLQNATIFHSFQPRDEVFNADVQPFFNCFTLLEKCIWLLLLSNIKFNCFRSRIMQLMYTGWEEHIQCNRLIPF